MGSSSGRETPVRRLVTIAGMSLTLRLASAQCFWYGYDPPAGALPDGAVGVSYAEPFCAQGINTQPHYWSVSGMLPPGLAFDPWAYNPNCTSNNLAASIGGIPMAIGLYPLAVSVGDSCGIPPIVTSYSLTISPCGGISVLGNVPNGTTALPYQTSLSSSGGTPPLTFSVASGPVPPGLRLASWGTFSGIPSAFGIYPFVSPTRMDALALTPTSS